MTSDCCMCKKIYRLKEKKNNKRNINKKEGI